MFKTISKVIGEDPEEKERLRKEVEERTAAEIDALAGKAEAEALAEKDALLANATARHDRDVAGYKFDCRRWGDFLSLFVERLELGWETEEYRPRTYATSVNIRETKELRLDEGHAPDVAGILKYYICLKRDDGNGSICGGGWERQPAPEGCHYYVWPDYPTPPARSMFRLDAPDEPYMNWEDDHPRYSTPNFVRFAADDVIRFEGVGASLFAPAGCGKAVYEKILREIGDHSLKTTSSDVS